MNDLQPGILVDILPPPPIATQSDSGWIVLALIMVLIVSAVLLVVLRSRAWAKFILRRQIAKRQIDPRTAASRLMRLAAAQDEKLLQRLRQIRYGPDAVQPAQLLELLRRLP